MIPTFGQKQHKPYTLRNASYALVLQSGKVLVVRNPANDCFLPGGGIQSIETPQEAVIREIREECAHHARIERDIGEAIQYFTCRKGRYYKMHAYFFCCALASESANIPEHAFSWENPHGLRFLYESHQWTLERILKEQEKLKA